MAIINKTGITSGGTIQAEHVTRAIDALSGGSTDTIAATGSFSGSFRGTLTGTASYAATAGTASYAATAPQIFTLITGSSYTNNTGDNINLNITGSVSTYVLPGNKGFARYTNDVNTLGVWGELIAADTSEVQPYKLVYLNYSRIKWQSVEQSTYDSDFQPLLGISLDAKSSGTILLNGYITAYNSASNSGSGVQLEESDSRLGHAVWVDEGTTSGSMSTAKPAGAGAVINVGHIIASGSTAAAAKNYLIRVNPRYITTI
jgi:hypothetical protein